MLEKELGSELKSMDFIDPIGPVIQFTFDINQKNQIDQFSKDLISNKTIDYFENQATVSQKAKDNLLLIGSLIVFFFAITLIISLIVISNTIKLTLFSQRILIKQMDLIGASWNFISKPYLIRTVLNGLWSAFLAIALLSFLLFNLQNVISSKSFEIIFQNYLIVSAIIVAIAIFLTTFVSYFSIRKYLKTNLVDLY